MYGVRKIGQVTLAGALLLGGAAACSAEADTSSPPTPAAATESASPSQAVSRQPIRVELDPARITADGQMLTCLYATSGIDLRAPLRDGSSDEALQAVIADRWRQRRDRGAEARLREPARGAFVTVSDLRRNAHLEMHTRGG